MRTWNEVIYCLAHDTMYNEITDEDRATRKPSSKRYIEFANEVIYYLSEFLKEINAKVIKSYYDDAVFDIVFEKDNKLYVSRNYRWNTRLYVYATDDIEEYQKHLYRQRKTTMLVDGNPYLSIGLPKHCTLKIGDLVKLRTTTPSYKYQYDFNKVLRVNGIYKRGVTILCTVDSVSPKGVTYNRYAEGNLKKLDSGL